MTTHRTNEMQLAGEAVALLVRHGFRHVDGRARFGGDSAGLERDVRAMLERERLEWADYTSTVWGGTAEVRPGRDGGLVILRSWCPLPIVCKGYADGRPALQAVLELLSGRAVLPGEDPREAAKRAARNGRA